MKAIVASLVLVSSTAFATSQPATLRSLTCRLSLGQDLVILSSSGTIKSGTEDLILVKGTSGEQNKTYAASFTTKTGFSTIILNEYKEDGSGPVVENKKEDDFQLAVGWDFSDRTSSSQYMPVRNFALSSGDSKRLSGMCVISLNPARY